MGTVCTLMRPFIQELIKGGKKSLAEIFNFTFRYNGDVLSINNPEYVKYLHIIYFPELEILNTTDTSTA